MKLNLLNSILSICEMPTSLVNNENNILQNKIKQMSKYEIDEIINFWSSVEDMTLEDFNNYLELINYDQRANTLAEKDEIISCLKKKYNYEKVEKELYKHEKPPREIRTFSNSKEYKNRELDRSIYELKQIIFRIVKFRTKFIAYEQKNIPKNKTQDAINAINIINKILSAGSFIPPFAGPLNIVKWTMRVFKGIFFIVERILASQIDYNIYYTETEKNLAENTSLEQIDYTLDVFQTHLSWFEKLKINGETINDEDLFALAIHIKLRKKFLEDLFIRLNADYFMTSVTLHSRYRLFEYFDIVDQY